MRTHTRLVAPALLVSALASNVFAAEQLPSDVPVRAQRRFMIGAELGWNSLAGLGVNASFHLLPRLALDGGVGLSSFGWKAGLRARVNFLTSEWTPFAAAGLLYGVGTGNTEINLSIPGEQLTYTLGPSPFLQLVGGVDFTGENGFTFLFTAGYAILLNPNNVHQTGNTPSAAATQALAISYGSGISVGVTLGYSF